LDDSIHLASWRNAVAVTAHDQHVPMFTDAVIVGLMFRLVRPRSVTVKRRRLPQVPPDLDKLMRSTFDGLVMGQLLVDDALVCSVWASKRYCAEDELPGCEIVIEALP
jgi:Holliday junction resolvase RusA-like endonuclease